MAKDIVLKPFEYEIVDTPSGEKPTSENKNIILYAGIGLVALLFLLKKK